MNLPFVKYKNIVTVLEIDDNWLKLAQAQILQGKQKVSRTLVTKIDKIAEEELIKIIRDLAKEYKIDPNYFIISIPSHFASIRNPEFPSLDLGEIKDMVELQIGKQTPYSINEIVYDYQRVYMSPDGYSRLILAIVRRDIIDRHIRVIEKAGLKAEGIVLSSEGMLKWSQFAHVDAKSKTTPFLLVDIDYSVSSLIVVLNNKMIFNRSISLGLSQFIQDTDKWHGEFIEEINRAIYAYNNEMVNKEISKIVISGSERVTARLNDNLLRDAFNLPVDIIAQFKDIPATKEVLSLYGGKIKDVSLSSLIGLSLKYEKKGISLIPQEIRIERSMKKRAKELYLLGILLAFTLVSISGIFLEKFYNKEHYLNQLKVKIASIQDRAGKLKVMAQRINLIDSRAGANGSVLNIIYEIYRVISPEVHLLSMSFDGKYSIDIRGSSTEMSDVFKFVNELEKSEYFENVKTKYVSKNKVEGQEIADFEIICPFNRTIQRTLRDY